MPIRPYLVGRVFDPETIKRMSDVLERICAELGIKLHDGRANPAAEIVAEKVIQYTQNGVQSPTALYLSVMADFKLRKPN